MSAQAARERGQQLSTGSTGVEMHLGVSDSRHIQRAVEELLESILAQAVHGVLQAQSWDSRYRRMLRWAWPTAMFTMLTAVECPHPTSLARSAWVRARNARRIPLMRRTIVMRCLRWNMASCSVVTPSTKR